MRASRSRESSALETEDEDSYLFFCSFVLKVTCLMKGCVNGICIEMVLSV